MPLNDEQKRVLEMVVDEGKNVFFTGAAGMYDLPTVTPPLVFFPCRLFRVLMIRDWEISVAPGYHLRFEEETC